MNWQASLGRGALDSSSIVGCSSCISQVSTFALSLVSFSKGISQYFAPILEGWLVVLRESNEA